MMATYPAAQSLPAARRSAPFTLGSCSTLTRAAATFPNRCRRLPACGSHPSADLAGRAVALSAEIPTVFDEPLSVHHRLIGRWVAAREPATRGYTRVAARRHVERVFDTAVLATLDAVELVDLRITVLDGRDNRPAAIAITCESMGQLDLGWIETGDAPVPWRAAAYALLDQTLGSVLPVFGYDDLFGEISAYYWDGETDDDGARQSLIACHGLSPDELEEQVLPSEMNARRPDWMIAANAGRPARLPSGLRQALRGIRDAHRALTKLPFERNAWHVDRDELYGYVPGIEECASLPPLTLVPFEQFARELDDVGRQGMEMGFMDVAGICPLPDAGWIDDWLASLTLGVRLLCAVQHLLHLDPASL